ncbi:TPA: haloacid dehalogenase-like hydrolase [Candidatus Poribacteria bacterium]|nr:haloacid dehalogenase-like hydrolase [Candidatus Poribacteria bacterium]HIA68662.1 haloacid dehalogenase-like hydrolase [Candidatus Poribacteria bacterium]HIB88221.1 haloacid dehalogenase-like hydrolase [Candidatus Poribacteria bacterium]HIB98684.1 haloacid dehalogenase-like hydrolase [Candidatus Poribacteria bacterium]HIO05519.1 haloacid dehalogenase-like hydrolase [Candidatus Poribacteria bacterium]
MLIGIDFDNTIVKYDHVFHKIALDQKLIPPDFSAQKLGIRDYIRQYKGDGNDVWTKLQGQVYGPGINYAIPFSGVIGFLEICKQKDISTSVVSHKTRYAQKGPKFDLHEAALQWLRSQGFLDISRTGLSLVHVYFNSTRSSKIRCLIEIGCTHFIDDLPEFFSDPQFPDTVEKILFDPYSNFADHGRLHRANSWQELINWIKHI